MILRVLKLIQFSLGKSRGWWVEKLGGICFGVVAGAVTYYIEPTSGNWLEIMKQFPTLGTCAFGFLLTFLGIILQGESETIVWLKSQDILYARFIRYNKRIVVLSLILTIYSYLIGYFDFDSLHNMSLDVISIFKSVSISVFVLAAVWFLFDTFGFVVLFYRLVQKS